jgi:hypothetical protein
MDTTNLIINIIVAAVAVGSCIGTCIWSIAKISNTTDKLKTFVEVKFAATDQKISDCKDNCGNELENIGGTALKACATATKAHERIDGHINDHAKGEFKTRPA